MKDLTEAATPAAGKSVYYSKECTVSTQSFLWVFKTVSLDSFIGCDCLKKNILTCTIIISSAVTDFWALWSLYFLLLHHLQTELIDGGPGLTQGDKLRALKSRRPPRPTRYQYQNQPLTEAKELRTVGAVWAVVEELVLLTV